MKKILTTIIILLFSYGAQAQTIGGKPVAEITEQYINIEFIGTTKNPRVLIMLDDGSRLLKGKILKGEVTLDEEGKEIIFLSHVAGLNFMYSVGYKVKNVLFTGRVIYLLEKFHPTK